MGRQTEGTTETTKNIARALKTAGVMIDIIIKTTGLTAAEIEYL